MSKRRFVAPYILLTGGAGNEMGGGSVHGAAGDPVTGPLSLNAWLNSNFAEDLIPDGETNLQDYVVWWDSMMATYPDVFTQAEWESLNPDMDWDDYFGD